MPYQPDNYGSGRNCVSCCILSIGGVIGLMFWGLFSQITPIFTYIAYGTWLMSIIITVVSYIKDMEYEKEYMEKVTLVLPERVPNHDIQPRT